MYIRSKLTTVIPDIAQYYVVEIDKTNIDLICYFALLRVRILALPQKKVPIEGVSKLYIGGSKLYMLFYTEALKAL